MTDYDRSIALVWIARVIQRTEEIHPVIPYLSIERDEALDLLYKIEWDIASETERRP